MSFKKSFLGCVLLLASNVALSEHIWNGIQGNPAHTGFVDVKSDPTKMHLIWNKPLKLKLDNDHMRSSNFNSRVEGVLIANQTLYASVSEYFYDKKSRNEIYLTSGLIALDVTTGEEKWQRIAGYDKGVGIPLYDGDKRVLLAVEADQGNQFIAYHSDSGVIDYTLPLENVSIFSQAFNGNLFSQSRVSLSSVNMRSGKLNWTRPANKDFEYADLMAVDNKYFILAQGGAIEVTDNTTGTRLFTIKADHAWEDQPFTKIPIYDQKNQMVYHGFRNTNQEGYGYGSVFAFDLVNRKVKWYAPNQFLQPVLAGDEIYAVGEYLDEWENKYITELHALDTATGKPTWAWSKNENFEFSFSSGRNILATADLVIVPGENKTIAISRKTHEKVWEIDKVGELAITDNRLFIINYEASYPQISAVALN